MNERLALVSVRDTPLDAIVKVTRALERLIGCALTEQTACATTCRAVTATPVRHHFTVTVRPARAAAKQQRVLKIEFYLDL